MGPCIRATDEAKKKKSAIEKKISYRETAQQSARGPSSNTSISHTTCHISCISRVIFYLCHRLVSLARSSLEPTLDNFELDNFERIFSFTLIIVAIVPHILSLPTALQISTSCDISVLGNRFVQSLELLDTAGCRSSPPEW